MSKTAKTKKLTVYMALVEHRHGHNLYAGGTELELLNKLHEYVSDSWNEFMEGKPMPKSKRQAIDQYFEASRDFGHQGEFLTEADDTIEVPSS